MKILKLCSACDRIISEMELNDLTNQNTDLTMEIVGNVAYTLCPGCLSEMEVQPRNTYH